MKQVGYVHVEIEKCEKDFVFAMPMGVSLADAADAAYQVFKTVDKMYRDAIDKEISAQDKIISDKEAASKSEPKK